MHSKLCLLRSRSRYAKAVIALSNLFQFRWPKYCGIHWPDSRTPCCPIKFSLVMKPPIIYLCIVTKVGLGRRPIITTFVVFVSVTLNGIMDSIELVKQDVMNENKKKKKTRKDSGVTKTNVIQFFWTFRIRLETSIGCERSEGGGITRSRV